MRTPNAFLGQSTVAMKQAAQKVEGAKGTQYPIGQILFFHERRLAELEKKEETTSTGADTKEYAALLVKVEHLEKLCQQLTMEVQQLKNQSTEENVHFEVEEEIDESED